MRTQALFISLCFLLLPVFGHGYSEVLAADLICEDIYPFPSCLDSYECVLLFMECQCVPRALREMLDENDPDKGHTLCLYADLILELGAPTCCLAQKRALIQRFEANVLQNTESNIVGQTAMDPQSPNQAPTPEVSAYKRTGDMNQNTEVDSRAQTLISSALWNKEQNRITNTQKATQNQDDKILQNLYKYLRQYIVRKEKKINTPSKRSVFINP